MIIEKCNGLKQWNIDKKNMIIQWADDYKAVYALDIFPI